MRKAEGRRKKEEMWTGWTGVDLVDSLWMLRNIGFLTMKGGCHAAGRTETGDDSSGPGGG